MILPRERDPIALAVALVNTWDVLNDPPELLREVETLRVVLRAFGLDKDAKRASERDLAPVRRARTASARVRSRQRRRCRRGAERPRARGGRCPAARAGERRLGLPLRAGPAAACHRARGAGVRSPSSGSSRRRAGRASACARRRPAAVSSSTGRETGAAATAAISAPTGRRRRPRGGRRKAGAA